MPHNSPTLARSTGAAGGAVLGTRGRRLLGREIESEAVSCPPPTVAPDIPMYARETRQREGNAASWDSIVS